MLIHTPKLISKWIMAGPVIKNVRKAYPFPGKNPTRIMLKSKVDDRYFDYFGKPSKTIYMSFMKFIGQMAKHPGPTVYVEFDRGGIVILTTQLFGQFATTTSNPLYTHYHPEILVNSWPNWLRYKYKVIDGVYKIA